MTIQAAIVRTTAAAFTVYGLGFVIAPELLSQSANILMCIYLAIEIGMAGISWWAYVHSAKIKRANPAVARDSKQ